MKKPGLERNNQNEIEVLSYLITSLDLWIALLGPNLAEGIVGIGSTAGAALRAFDAQYLAGQRPPNEKIRSSIKTRQSYTVQLRRLPEC